MMKFKRIISKPFRMKKRATRQVLPPKALREQVWLRVYGKTFSNKCFITWCSNEVTPFDFHIGHNIPKSRGGQTRSRICSRSVADATYPWEVDIQSRSGGGGGFSVAPCKQAAMTRTAALTLSG